MADVNITPANVAMTANSTPESVKLGETLAAGDPVYQASDGMVYGADNSTKANANVRGILVTGGVAGVKATLAKGELDVGSVLTANEVYVVSATSKKIAPSSDLATNDWVTIVGIAKSTSLLQIDPNPQNYQAP